MIRNYKKDVDNWIPVYWRWSFALVQFLEGFVNLFLVWFGFEVSVTLDYMTWVMDRLEVQ